MSIEEQRKMIARVCWNSAQRDREMEEDQLKSPFDVLAKDGKEALIRDKWR
jgi:hypothetical protein